MAYPLPRHPVWGGTGDPVDLDHFQEAFPLIA
jgi:hypothetical protein